MMSCKIEYNFAKKYQNLTTIVDSLEL